MSFIEAATRLSFSPATGVVVVEEAAHPHAPAPAFLDPISHLSELVDGDHEGRVFIGVIFGTPRAREAVHIYEVVTVGENVVSNPLQVFLKEPVLGVGLFSTLVELVWLHGYRWPDL